MKRATPPQVQPPNPDLNAALADGDMVAIRCGHCGRYGSLRAFTDRPVSGPLPIGQFQCPHCCYAFRRCEAGPIQTWVASNGDRLTFRERIELRPCAAVL
jgi:hypothetical protein